jgi:hypothetical protein
MKRTSHLTGILMPSRLIIRLFLAATVLAAPLWSGCAGGPAISKKHLGNLEINITAPESIDSRTARIYVDNVYVGNVSERMPVLYLKRGKRIVRVELRGTRLYQETIEILGDPNHQVLNVILEPQ